MAKVNSYERKGFAAEEVEIISPEVKVDMEAGRRGEDPIGNIEIATDKIINNSQLEMERFMADELEVQLLESGSEDENQFVEVKVNGLGYVARRGDIVTMKRCHVAVLAQAKELRLKQVKVVNPDGSMGYNETMVSKLTYPFSIIHDPAGRKGSDWLRQQLQNRS